MQFCPDSVSLQRFCSVNHFANFSAGTDIDTEECDVCNTAVQCILQNKPISKSCFILAKYPNQKTFGP